METQAQRPGQSHKSSPESELRRRPPIGRLHLLIVMCGLVLMGGCNFVLLKVMYTAYGGRRAFFVNQAINLLYIVYGGAVLYPRMLFTDHVTRKMQSLPKRHFFVMGVLDSMGTFLTCLGAAYTPGSLTPLLNQLLIPCTMTISVACLQVHYGYKEVLGAVLIVAGACLSIAPNLVVQEGDSAASEVRWYAVLFYTLSNIPMAMSSCYKEASFEENQLDVWYLTQWVSIFQFLISFLYMPLLVLPGFSSRDGMALDEVPQAFADGFHCYMQWDPECAERATFWLLTGYCGVNVSFNTLGLYLTKHGSALLNALSYSILLPFTTLLFFTPMLGSFQEPLTATSVFTLTGLLLALVGFGVYQRFAQQVGGVEQGAEKKVIIHDSSSFAPLCAPLLECAPVLDAVLDGDPEHARQHSKQHSFQERVVTSVAFPPPYTVKRQISGSSDGKEKWPGPDDRSRSTTL